MRYQLEIDIDLPRERILDLFLNQDNLQKWQPDLVSLEPLGWEGDYTVGAKTKQIHKMGNREIEMIETITEYDYPESFSATYEADGVWNLIENQFVDVDAGKTRWVVDSEFKCSGFMMKLMTWVLPGMFKKQTLTFMQRFKEYAENAA